MKEKEKNDMKKIFIKYIILLLETMQEEQIEEIYKYALLVANDSNE